MRCVSLQVPAGTAGIPVGQTIALLAEEGDDISNLEFPPPSSSSDQTASPTESQPAVAESDAPTPSPMTPTNHASAIHAHPTHSKPLLPSVLRQLALAGITDTTDIKATGHKGMLTKGDVLAFLGKIASPHGSIKEENLHQKHPALEYAASPKDVRHELSHEFKNGQMTDSFVCCRLNLKFKFNLTDLPSDDLLLLDLHPLRQKPPLRQSPLSVSGKNLFSCRLDELTLLEPVLTAFDSILEDYLPPSSQFSASASSPSPSTTIPPPPPAQNDFDAFLDL